MNNLCIPYALFLATLERRAKKGFLRGERVFEDKNLRFLSLKTRSPRQIYLRGVF
jgi:hypothetical protein